MRGTTTIGVVSGFTALFTSTLGGSALACTHQAVASDVMSAGMVRSVDDIRADLAPAKEADRLATYAKWAHGALAALDAKASNLAGDISAAASKNAPAKLLARASSARTAALADLADARQSLAAADAAIAAGDNATAAEDLRTAWARLHDAAAALGLSRMLVAGALHAAFVAAKAAQLKAAASHDVVQFGAGQFDGRHHCDGYGDRNHDGGYQRDGYRRDAYQHDGYHRDWHR